GDFIRTQTDRSSAFLLFGNGDLIVERISPQLKIWSHPSDRFHLGRGEMEEKGLLKALVNKCVKRIMGEDTDGVAGAQEGGAEVFDMAKARVKQAIIVAAKRDQWPRPENLGEGSRLQGYQSYDVPDVTSAHRAAVVPLSTAYLLVAAHPGGGWSYCDDRDREYFFGVLEDAFEIPLVDPWRRAERSGTGIAHFGRRQDRGGLDRCGRARFGDVVVLRRGGVLVFLAVAIGMMRAQGVTEFEVIDKKKVAQGKGNGHSVGCAVDGSSDSSNSSMGTAGCWMKPHGEVFGGELFSGLFGLRRAASCELGLCSHGPIIVAALWMKYSDSVSARVLECPGLRGATASPSGVSGRLPETLRLREVTSLTEVTSRRLAFAAVSDTGRTAAFRYVYDLINDLVSANVVPFDQFDYLYVPAEETVNLVVEVGVRAANNVLDFKVISRMMFLTYPQLIVQLLFLSQRHTSSLALIRVVVAVIAMIGIARGFSCGRARFGDVVVLRRGGVLVALAVAIGMMRAQGITECEVIDKKKFYASKRCAETEFRDGPKGLKYREVKIGEGKTATKGSLCTVHYEGKSLSGSRMECTFKNSLTGIRFYCGKRRSISFELAELVFDLGCSSLTGLSMSIFLGSPQPTVAAFLNEGVVGMREGGHREMIVPPHMHYPERWPNRILIYEVSLMRVRGGEGNEEADAVEEEEFDNMPWLAKSLFPPPPPTYLWSRPISERLGPQ
ncbi:hypothetical protein FOZ62_009183, partial [Perkinsus olseni]